MTVTVWLPVIVGFWFAVAVTVAVPIATDVTNPVDEIVAVVVGVMVQLTDGLSVMLPSLFVPTAVICTVLPVVPVSMVGDAGPTAIDDRIGFWKNPRQLTAKASRPSAVREPASFSLFLIENEDLDDVDPDDIGADSRAARAAKTMELGRFLEF